ncbi:MAG: SCP2 sterol-binding domain-containing protein [Candidatus Latescibacterota bacterium]
MRLAERSQGTSDTMQRRFAGLSRSLPRSTNGNEELAELIESIKRIPEVVADLEKGGGRKVAVFEATDTGGVVSIVFDGGDISACLGRVEDCDLRFQATEAIHLGILSGRLDPDSAFFARKIKIHGSLFEAIKLKNLFLRMQRRTL